MDESSMSQKKYITYTNDTKALVVLLKIIWIFFFPNGVLSSTSYAIKVEILLASPHVIKFYVNFMVSRIPLSLCQVLKFNH